MKTLIIYGLLLLALAKSDHLRSQDQNIKPVYDINDPRNPDCPYHKLQEMADEEYRLKQQKADQKTNITSSVPGGSSVKSHGKRKPVRKIKKIYKRKGSWLHFGRQGLYPVKRGKFLSCC